jgi:hypothetical protein
VTRRLLRPVLTAGLWSALLAMPVVQASPLLHASPVASSDGVIQLHWALDGRRVELQRAADAAFAHPVTLYRGTDSASLRSGLVDGRYFFRLRALQADGRPGPWSKPLAVRVAHHAALRAWGMFGLGALVFLATLGLVVWGGRREAGDE